MFKDFYFKVYNSLLNAAHINNTITTNPKITMLDCNILCLIKSFHESNKPFYMTNEQLAKMFLVTENTVKASLNRLYWRGFIKSEGKKKRVITYIPEEIDKFIQEMNFIGTKFVP